MCSEYLSDSPVVARAYCPDCEPNADPIEEILDLRWCERHGPRMMGSEDCLVDSQGYLSGSAEAGGDDNRRACEFFHRGVIST